MKKLHFIGIIALCMISFQAKGQSSVGVKTDVNLSDFWVNQSTHLKSNMKVGGSAGFFYKYALALHNRAIQTDILFRFLSSEFKNQSTGETADYRYFGIELPVYFMMQAEIDDQTLYLGIGPFASFGLSSYYQSPFRRIELYEEDPVSGKATMRRWDYGVGFIIGYEMKCRLQFNFNYQMGFRNMVGDGFENIDMISQLVSLGVGYRF